MAGDALAGFAMMVLGVTVLFLLGSVGYGVSFHGSIPALIAGVFLSASAFLAVGYVLAGFLPTARVATLVGNVLVYPMVILSGSVVPHQIMPETVQNIARFVPLTHVVTLIRGLWSGNHMGEHILEISVLAGLIILGAALAAWTFRWE
jgi:ABC-2 type transport system permease protein